MEGRGLLLPITSKLDFDGVGYRCPEKAGSTFAKRQKRPYEL
jgi:hypothetical protein